MHLYIELWARKVGNYKNAMRLLLSRKYYKYFYENSVTDSVNIVIDSYLLVTYSSKNN